MQRGEGRGTMYATQTTQGPAIEVAGLVKVYPGGKTALAGISLSVDRGEIFGFLGPNGSGKTTTVRILVTLLGKTSGRARVGGFDTDRQAGRVRELIGYAGQSVGIDDDLSAAENLTLGGALHGLGRDQSRQRAAELLATFSLDEVADVRAGRLSGGLRRRLDLAQALVHAPAVLFLDEPTTGLDPQSRNALWGTLRQLREQGTTVFLTTQYLEEADRTCDRVAILDDGRLLKVGTPPTSCLRADGVPTLSRRPSSRMATRSQVRSASSRYWVVKNTVVPCSRSCRRVPHRALRDCGSSPVVGSSRNKTAGACTRAWARSRPWCSPPDSRPARTSATSSRENVASSSAARWRDWSRPRPCRAPPRVRFSAALRSSSMPTDWPA